MHEDERYQAGLRERRRVLGDAHVERSLAARTAFTDEFQALITRYAWGTIWTRDGLPAHTRSLLTLAMMVALGHDEEFKLHVRAARNNGVTPSRSRKCCCRPRSIAACRPPTMPLRWPSPSSRSRRATQGRQAKADNHGDARVQQARVADTPGGDAPRSVRMACRC